VVPGDGVVRADSLVAAAGTAGGDDGVVAQPMSSAQTKRADRRRADLERQRLCMGDTSTMSRKRGGSASASASEGMDLREFNIMAG
jgi:hypothetical protein